MGRHAEAIGECSQMQKLDPLSPFAHVSLGWAYYFARDYDRAIEECRKALEMEQNSTFAYRILGFAYLQKGKVDKALAALKKAVRFSSGGLAFEAHLGYAYALAGKHAEALKVLSDFEKIARQRYVSSYYFAVIHLGLGETGKSLSVAGKSFRRTLRFYAVFERRADARFDSRRRAICGFAPKNEFAGE